jgi:hypothetical protein
MEGNLDLFEFSFLFFSVKAPAQKEKELSLTKLPGNPKRS